MRKALALVWLLFPCLALGQAYTTVTATNVTVDNGSGTAVNPPSGSSLCFLGVNNAGAPITYTPSGGSPVSGTVCQTLNSSGALTGSLQVANPALASPLGLLYTITVVNGGTTYLTIPTVSLSGSLFNFNTYALPGTGIAVGIGKAHLACADGAQWTSTTLPPGQQNQRCNSGGNWQSYPPANYCPSGQAYLVPQQGGTPFCLPPVLSGNGAPSGTCTQNSFYIEQDNTNLYACKSATWVLVGSGGGGSISLTTTGTSGPSTLSGSVLNVPVYQGQVTLTTLGTAGASTFIGNTLNIPNYAGGNVFTRPNFDSLVGAFTDSSGNVIEPVAFGNGPTTFYIPTGATQLQLGVNDDILDDQTGSWVVSVNGTHYTVPATTPPWVHTGGINANFPTGVTTSSSPVVAAIGAAGTALTVQYVSGTITDYQLCGVPGTGTFDASGQAGCAIAFDGPSILPGYWTLSSVSAVGAITGLSGDVSASGPGNVPATLATVNTGSGTCGDSTHICQVTTNPKGLVTNQSQIAIAGGGFSAGGDLSGTSTSQTVVGIQNKSVPTPTIGFLYYTGSGFAWSLPPNGAVITTSTTAACSGMYRDDASGAITLTLPAVLQGCQVAVQRGAAAGTLTIAGGTGYDGVTTQLPQGESIFFWNDGTQWHSTAPILAGSHCTLTPALTGNTLDCPSGGTGGTIGYSSSHTLASGDANHLLIFTCSSACAITVPATQPGSPWSASIVSYGSTTPTITLAGGATYNGGSTPPTLTEGIVWSVWANSGITTDYEGNAPITPGTNVTFTPSIYGVAINSSASGGGYTNLNGTGSQTTVAQLNTLCASGTIYATTPLSIATGGTLSCAVQFSKAGLWTVASGQTVTFSQPITETDGPNQHFAGSGVVVYAAGQRAQAAWSGAVNDWNGSTGTDNTTTLQAVLTALSTNGGTMVLSAGACYETTAALSITASGVNIVGAVFGTLATQYGTQQPGSCIITTSASADIIDVAGASTPAYLVYNTFKDFSVQRSTTPSGSAKGFSFSYTCSTIVSNTSSSDSIYDYYLKGAPGCGNGRFEYSSAFWGLNGFHYTSGTDYGWYLDGATTSYDSILMTGDQASSGNSGTTVWGGYITGAYINDVFLDGFSTATATHGIGIVSTGTAANTAGDIRISNCVLNGSYDSSLYISSVAFSQQPGIKVEGCDINSQGGAYIVDVESSPGGVNLVGNVIWPTNATSGGSTASVYLNGSNAAMTGNQITTSNSHTGILVNSSSPNLTGNTIYGINAATANIAISLTSATNGSYSGNIGGRCTTGISADASSTGNHWLNVNQMAACTTALSDSGSGNQLSSGSVANALTMNNSGSGAASGSTFDGSAAKTLSYNTIGAAPLASPTFTGTTTIPGLTLSGITGSTQCLQVNSSGAVGGTGSACGSGGGGYPSSESHTASNSAELDFTSCISSSNRDYQIRFDHVLPATTNVTFLLQVSTNGGSTYDTTTANYTSSKLASSTTTTDSSYTHITSLAGVGLWWTDLSSSASLGGYNGALIFSDPLNASSGKLITGNVIGANNGSNIYQITLGGQYSPTTAVNAFRVIMSSGNITSGTVTCQPLPN